MTQLGGWIQRAQSSDLVRHGLLVLVCLTGANVLSYAFYAVVGRMVGVENYGVFSSVVAAIIIFTTPAIIGQTIVAKLAADFRAAEDPAGLRGFADAVTRFALALGGALGLAGIMLARPVAAFLHIADTVIIVLAAVALAAGIVMWLQRGVFQGAGAFGSFGVSSLIEGFGKMVFALVFVSLYGLRGAFIGLALGLGASVAYNEVRIRQRFGSVGRRFHADPRRIALSASATGLAVFAITAMLLFDVILVKHYFGAREAGLYGAAALIGRSFYTVVSFVPTIVLPKASGTVAARRSPLPLLFGAGAVTIACCAAALAVFRIAPQAVIVAIAGSKFIAAAPLVFPYGCATASLATANVFAMYKIGLHRFDFVVPLALVMAGEVASVALRHRTLADVLQTIVIGHTVGLAVVVWRLTADSTTKRIVEPLVMPSEGTAR
jgi:O-antigen/teichoic acid export membrane protein